MTEFVDIFDASYNYLGTEEKNEAHRKGLWHQSFHCWIVTPDNKLVVQLRGKDKKTSPNLLDISGAGHISAGEKIEDGVRELKEELGLDVDPKDLIYAGFFKWASDKPNQKIVPYHNREFCHTYFLKDITPLSEYKLQPEEVDAVFAIDLEDIKKLFLEEVKTIKINGYKRNDDNSLSECEREVELNDFNNRGTLWLKVVNIIEDINNNREHVYI